MSQNHRLVSCSNSYDKIGQGIWNTLSRFDNNNLTFAVPIDWKEMNIRSLNDCIMVCCSWCWYSQLPLNLQKNTTSAPRSDGTTDMYRVFRKNCVFFTIHCNTSLAYIAARDLQNSQRNASVKSLLLAGSFFVQLIVAE